MENMIMKSMSLTALDVQEVSNTHGGGLIDAFAPVLKKLTPAAIAYYVMENWEDVKKGFSDGWNVR
jgi:hypothetical protein